MPTPKLLAISLMLGLWETQPDTMKAAFERLGQTLSDAIASHRGVRPVEQGEGDSFVIAFARAADAVACALDLQRAPLAPIKLRIGLHTGDIQLRDEGNYIGPTINRTARLRDLAHGVHNDFPPLRTTNAIAAERLPAQLTSFIGRQTEMKGIREALADNRPVTLTGAGSYLLPPSALPAACL
jgi:class 3 adenylate cyclase